MLSLDEVASLLKVSTGTVKRWRNYGLVQAHVYNDKRECLYEHPGDDPPVKIMGRKLVQRRRFSKVDPNRAKEVQCET